jgi:hypothetical protein
VTGFKVSKLQGFKASEFQGFKERAGGTEDLGCEVAGLKVSNLGIRVI